MRPSRSKAIRWAVVATALLLARRSAFAQSGPPVEGAPELILPIGARAIGMGEAAVASAIGADALWWNPALIARGPREVALAASSNNPALDTDIGASVIVPVPRVGAFAVLLRYQNQGEQEAASSEGGPTQTGTFLVTSTLAALTFAAPFGNRIAIGTTYKFLNADHASCTGQCGQTGAQPQTTALDFGGQYIVRKDTSIVLGAVLRNAGLRLQVNDAPQADPVPTRFEAGVLVTPRISQLPPEARLHVAADVITRVNTSGGPGYRLGAEASWRERFYLRGGYLVYGPDGASGPSFGVGFSTGKLQIDFAQTSNNAGSGSPPSYLTLRYLF